MIRFIDGQLWISVSHWRDLPLAKDDPAIEDFNLEKEIRKVVQEVFGGLSPKQIKSLYRAFKHWDQGNGT